MRGVFVKVHIMRKPLIHGYYVLISVYLSECECRCVCEFYTVSIQTHGY